MEQSAAMLKEASNEELLRQLVFLDYGWNTEYVNLIKTEVLSFRKNQIVSKANYLK
jgi:hypothetical protein